MSFINYGKDYAIQLCLASSERTPFPKKCSVLLLEHFLLSWKKPQILDFIEFRVNTKDVS